MEVRELGSAMGWSWRDSWDKGWRERLLEVEVLQITSTEGLRQGGQGHINMLLHELAYLHS